MTNGRMEHRVAELRQPRKKFVRKPDTDVLVKDYDVPQPLANRLVGATEHDTQAAVSEFIAYIHYLVDRHKEYMGVG